MERYFVVKIADNIISPLGLSSEDNYQAVKAGKSALCRYEGKWDIPEPFVASLIDRDIVEEACSALPLHKEKYTFFEKLLILSVSKALASVSIDVMSEKTLFLFSTTKGNVFLLDKRWQNDVIQGRVLLGKSAEMVTTYFRNPNRPVVISNACISGLCAQIEALRCLQSSKYNNVIVIGADCQSPFIVSGFQSFKALSPELCRPFDLHRRGLNLGEAAATLIYSKKEINSCSADDWIAYKGAIRNDANHISGPSRTGEGCFRALKQILCGENLDKLAFVNVHGTATLYNDEMESIALHRIGLDNVPVSALKGYYGHTMGAAGILETILSMYAVDDGIILATKGYNSSGVTYPLSISNQHRVTNRKSFVKLLSGFGGCNAALLLKRRECL